MTSIYFVRHAQPDFSWAEDLTRPLTAEGEQYSKEVTKALKSIHLDFAFCSPYKRSMDTIKETVAEHNLIIHTDFRLREREKGKNGNVYGMFQRRWNDFDYHEDGGECLRSVQNRNIEALLEVLDTHKNESIIWGTHGTALSTILNYFDNSFLCDGFLRIIDFMPYIIRIDFDGKILVAKEELLIIEKEFKGSNRADKKD